MVTLGGFEALRNLGDSFAELKRLKGLSLQGCANLDRLPLEIAELKCLRGLSLAECDTLCELFDDPTSEGATEMTEVISKLDLERLELDGWKGAAAAELLDRVAASLPNLRGLGLRHCKEGLKLKPLHAPKLDHINFSDSELGHFDAHAVLAECTASLRNLNLAGTGLTEARRDAARPPTSTHLAPTPRPPRLARPSPPRSGSRRRPPSNGSTSTATPTSTLRT